MNEALRAAVRFAQAHESRWPRDPAAPLAPGAVPWGVHHGDPPPFNRLRGPVHARGAQSGVVWQHGDEIAAWGEPARADLTFSVAKSYLALLAGIAQRDGLLPDEDACVADRLPGIGFDSAHNRAITWTHLLTQTSEWEGTCFGIPDTVDRWRKVALDPHPRRRPQGRSAAAASAGELLGIQRCAHQPARAGAAPSVRRSRLPKLFLEEVLVPLGGGEGFAWDGYDDSWIELPLVGRAQSVPGGSHWGGGVSISARDQARIGQMLLDGGAVVGRTTRRPRLDRAHGARPCADRAVLRPAALAEPGRHARFPARRRAPSSCSARAATTCGSIPSSTAWSSCAGSTPRTPRRRSSASPTRCGAELARAYGSTSARRADESPAAAELADGEHELVGALLERKVDGVVLRIDDAEEARIAEVLRAAAAVEDLAVQEHADVVAVADARASSPGRGRTRSWSARTRPSSPAAARAASRSRSRTRLAGAGSRGSGRGRRSRAAPPRPPATDRWRSRAAASARSRLRTSASYDGERLHFDERPGRHRREVALPRPRRACRAPRSSRSTPRPSERAERELALLDAALQVGHDERRRVHVLDVQLRLRPVDLQPQVKPGVLRDVDRARESGPVVELPVARRCSRPACTASRRAAPTCAGAGRPIRRRRRRR